MSLSAVASFSAACRAIANAAHVLDKAAADHLGQDPDAIRWAAAEHATRLARQVEALAAEVQALGRVE
jgi:hypothetical protein